MGKKRCVGGRVRSSCSRDVTSFWFLPPPPTRNHKYFWNVTDKAHTLFKVVDGDFTWINRISYQLLELCIFISLCLFSMFTYLLLWLTVFSAAENVPMVGLIKAYHILSFHILYLIWSYLIISYHIESYRIVCYHFISYFTLTLPFRILSYWFYFKN